MTNLDRISRRALCKRDPCEWNPEMGRASYTDEFHAVAEIIVGADGAWRLCAKCVALKIFKQYRKRVAIKSPARELLACKRCGFEVGAGEEDRGRLCPECHGELGPIGECEEWSIKRHAKGQ